MSIAPETEKCYLFVNNAAPAAVTICSRISYIFNNLPLSFLISPCYDDDTIQNQNQQIEQVHLLAALLRQDGGLVPQLLKKMGVTVESLDAAVSKELEKLPCPAILKLPTAVHYFLMKSVKCL